MTTQLLMYERAVPVTVQSHGDWSVKTGTEYGFARHVNSVPLMAVEFANAAQEYGIIFTGADDAVMPAVILGVRQNENLYIGENDRWLAKYIPAFVRRYPFVFSSSDDGATFTLCIDESFSGCNTEGRGERLFDSAGERTRYLQDILNFLQEFQVQFQRTRAFCKKLVDLNLLEPMQAQFRLGDGQQTALTGFQAVNRERLKAVPPETLSEMARTDELELIYTHLQSMRNLVPMAERAAGTAATDDAAPAATKEEVAS